MSIMTENIIMTPPAAPLQLDLGMDIFNNMPVDDFMGGGPSSEENGSIATTSTYPNDPEHPNDPELDRKRQAYVQIVEQPQPKALRFRYICEGRSAGSIPGIRSIAENKTFPTIKIIGYKGPAVVVVSCVTVDEPHRPHPHNLVGKEGCNKGVCTVTITDSDSMECAFSNLGIQCVKKRDVEDALKQRKNIRVDPFGTGFSHGNNHNQPIDLNAVRLCFQVFLSNSENRRFTFPLKPVVSDPIFDKKATSDLKICKLSECTSCVSGGKDIILLCEKVTKEDIQIRFFEEKDGRIEWEAFGEFLPADVHKQVAISFKTPKYKNLDVTISVSCFIQLQRTSDKSCTSEPLPFEYIPMDAGRPFRSFKRLRNNNGLFHRILGLDNPLGFSDDTLTHKTTGGAAPPSPAVAVARLPSPQPHKFALTSPPQPPAAPIGTSVDDIKLRMTASLDKSRVPDAQSHMLQTKWTDDSLYSDIVDEVLSQGSVNDLLSAVGDNLTVYEDVEALTRHEGQVNPDAIDALYGDASYASCYSNLEFAMGRINGPHLPPKKSPQRTQLPDDFHIYGTPSGRPVHPNKEALLRERGFNVCLQPPQEATKDSENNVIYLPVSDIIEEEEYKEVTHEELPQTILDLFV